VDSSLTGAWIIRVGDRPFQAELLATIRRWRFDAGIRDGAPVRSALRLVVATDIGNDTLPSRLAWRYVAGTAEDSLLGTWSTEPAVPPLDAATVDRVYEATLGQLRRQGIVLPHRERRLCLLLADGDSAREARLSRALARLLADVSNVHAYPVAPPGCEREPGTSRLMLPRVHATESGRVVLFPSGDDLASWPGGSPGRAYAAWNGRCVAQLHDARPLSVACTVMPVLTADVRADLLRDDARRRAWLGRPASRTPSAVDSVSMTALFAMNGAGAVDTVRSTRQPLPRLGARAEPDTIRRDMLDPARNTFTESAAVRVRLGDLRGATAAENVFRLRVHADPAPDDLMLFVVMRRPGWRPLVNFLRRVDFDTWDYLVSHGDDLPDDTELLLYMFGR
jgi:hypothetical protein